MPAIGIDLGTTTCCVAAVKNGVLQIVPNNFGKRTTPSWISFRNGEAVVGDSAKRNAQRYFKSTVYDIKYVIGLKYSDLKINKGVEKVPFMILNQKEKLHIAVYDNDRTDMYTPEELSGMLLRELKNYAEAYLDCNVDKAVITVPTYFNDSQRQATIDAGKIAGFKDVSLLNEPTAAAIAYGEENAIERTRNILVYDFGGGTFDVSIIACCKDSYEVLAIDGDLQLGGEDITRNLLDFFVKLFKHDYKFDILQNQRKYCRLKTICESCKIELADETCVEIELCELLGDDGFHDFKLTREHFEQINSDIFARTMEIIENCLRKGRFSKDDIDEVVLVGGSTRNAKVGELLKAYFNKPIKRSINADEAVASGAAIVAAKWDGAYGRNIEFTNITPYSLGVETKGGKMNVIIPKHTKIPMTLKKYFSTSWDGQTSIRIKIYSGENELTSENTFLGQFEVHGIAAGAKGRVLEETFHVDENGVLTVTAKDTRGKSEQLAITVEKGRLTQEEIDKITKKVETSIKKVRFQN